MFTGWGPYADVQLSLKISANSVRIIEKNSQLATK